MHSHSSECDEETALGALLDTFDSSLSLEEIASAYCRADRNVHAAGEILSGLQEGSCNSVNHASNSELSGAKTQKLEPEDSSQMLTHLQKKCNRSKPKKISVSTGMVSSILGKGCTRPTSSSSKFKAAKQLKLELKEPPKDELSVDAAALDYEAQMEPLNNREIEEFLFSLLEDGFQLGMDVIRDVLGSCGYDAKESMNKLLDLSTKALGKREDKHDDSTQEFIGKHVGVGSQLQSTEFAQSNGTASLGMASEKRDLPREVLESLFIVPERSGEIPKEKHLVTAVKRTRAFGAVVTEPPPDLVTEPSSSIVEPQQDSEYAAAEEDKHQVFRIAAKRNWDAMKAYYEAAIDEFRKGNHKQANYLREQGKFYNEKAREANEKAAREILEVRNLPVQDEVTLDLHDHHVKEAVRLLKFHLTKLASIHAFQFLKVIVNTSTEDITKGARKRLVRRLLEKESIKWREEVGNPGTIIIPLDEINPGRLSFAKSCE